MTALARVCADCCLPPPFDWSRTRPTHLGHVIPADPAGELAGVLVAQRRVLDPGDQRHAPAQRGDPALRVVQVVLGERGADRELEQRGSARDQIAQRPVTGLQPQVARVHAVGSDRDEGLPGQVLVAVERLDRRRTARRVAVEDVDELAAKEVVVHHESPQHREVFVAERGAAGRDRGGHPGQMHRHDVGVALDDDRLVPLGDVPLGQVETEQHRRLLVQHGLGGVDVLGLRSGRRRTAGGHRTR